MLADLQNSVATGVLLVVVIILFALGFRASLFIGIAIPASFLAGVLGLQLAGLTVNIVVLFSLILAVGMLVDDAIIVSEFAERRMAEGMPPKEAYSLAAKRMSGPVIAATATRVAAFSPLLFWPGVVGEFMKYLPITLIATLSASLAVALFFTPTLGALLGKASPVPHDERATDRRALHAHGAARAAPSRHDAGARRAACWSRVQVAYGKFGTRRRVLPQRRAGLRPGDRARPRQPLARREEPRARRGREARARDRRPARPSTPASASSRAARARSPRTPSASSSSSSPTGRRARPAHEIMDGIRAATADIPGILVEVTAPRAGPPTGKPIQVQLGALDPGAAAGGGQEGRRHPGAALRHPRSRRRPAAARHRLEDRGRQGRGREVRRRPEHRSAPRVQLVTNGVKVTEYRPSDSDKAVDILVRFPEDRRSLDQIDELRVQTAGRLRADRQFRRARRRRRASATSTASPATA